LTNVIIKQPVWMREEAMAVSAHTRQSPFSPCKHTRSAKSTAPNEDHLTLVALCKICMMQVICKLDSQNLGYLRWLTIKFTPFVIPSFFLLMNPFNKTIVTINTHAPSDQKLRTPILQQTIWEPPDPYQKRFWQWSHH
jgi:hypothetical protein